MKQLHSASVRELDRKSRTIRTDMLFNATYDRINHLFLFSPESKQNDSGGWKHRVVNYSRRNRKTKCKVCSSNWDIGIVYCTCGYFLRKRGENQKFIKYTMDLFSIPDHVTKKGRPHGHRYGKKPGDREYYTANQLKKKCKKLFFQSIHDRFTRDETFRNRMIEKGRDEDACRQMDPTTTLPLQK